MLRSVLSVVGLLIVAVVLFVATRPSAFRVERSTVIAAPPATVFALVNDLTKFPSWSPWETLDPAMQRTFGGPPFGPGATYRWAGNDKVGKGTMAIRSSVDLTSVDIDLEFIEPFPSVAQAGFRLEPQAGGTKITWVMDGTNDGFLAKFFGLVMGVEAMIGRDYEAGLANMKRVAEGAG